MTAAPQVRGHHLLCLLTYVGRGYSSAFVRAMDALAVHVAGDNPVRLCVGPDILCASLAGGQTGCEAHCHQARNVERDHVALQQISAVLKRPVRIGALETLSTDELSILRAALGPLDAQAATSGLRAACAGCEWLGLCRDVTRQAFAGARIAAAPVARAAVV